MKKGTRNIIISTIVMMTFMSIFTIRVHAENVYENFKYEIVDEAITITGYEGAGEGDLIVPSEIAGHSVKVIADNAFNGCSGFAGNLTIPDSVVTIGNNAFKDCNGLNRILTIGNGVTSIGSSAFDGCRFKGELVIPNSVEYIGAGAFNGCKGFTGELKIPSGITAIEQDTFRGCSGFTGNLTIPDTVSMIGNNAFDGCSGFNGGLTIPNNVTLIGDYAFNQCSGLSGDLIIPDTVTSIGNHAFCGCSGFRGKLTLPNGIKTIENASFSDGNFTGTLVIPESVTVIGDEAFNNCKGFTGDLIIPNKVTTLGNKAFYACKGFNGTLTIGTFVETIGDSCFYDDRYFTGELNIPNSVEKIGKNSFYQCYGFWNLILGNSVEIIDNYAFSGCFENSRYQNPSYYTYFKLSLPDSLKVIGNGAFYNCSQITIMSIPQNVTTIGNNAFYGCDGIRDLTIPDGVTSVGIHAFSNTNFASGPLIIGDGVTVIEDSTFENVRCSGGLIIGENVKTIGKDAFANSTFSGDLVIPESVTSIGENAFKSCVNLEGNLTIGNGVKTIGSAAFSGCNFTGKLTIGNGITEIGSEFRGCKFTGNLIIPESVTTIGADAFNGCSGFTGDLIIPESVTTIGASAFNGCSGFTGDLIIPESVTSIGDSAFNGCSGFTGNLIIPKSVTAVGNHVFQECNGFTGNLIIPESVTTIGAGAFNGCSGFTGELRIPKNVTSIGNTAFGGCRGFTGNLIIPESVTTIGADAFRGCSGFTGDLIIPENVTSIGNEAFYYCKGFNGKLIIPESVITIGDQTFKECTGFTGDLNIPNVKTIGSEAFKNCYNMKGELTLPDTLQSVGNNAFSGDDFSLINVPYGFISGNISSENYCKTKNRDYKLKYRIVAQKAVVCGYEGNPTGKLVIPSKYGEYEVTSIADRSFVNCKNFTGSLVLPEGITKIGEYAFSNCSGLSGDLIFPDSVTTIGQYAFESCVGLNGKLILPEGVSVGDAAFKGCSNISLIKVPYPDESYLGDSVFESCTENIIYSGEYIVSFNKNSSKASGTMNNRKTTNKMLELPECEFTEPDGKRFVGWSYSFDGNIIDTPQISLEKDTTLYALWEDIPTCTVLFAGGDNALGIAPDSVKVSQGSSFDLPKNTFTKKGYEFIGWKYETNTYAENTSFTVPYLNAIVLEAKWKKLPVYTISFDGGKGATGIVPDSLSGNENDEVILPENAFNKKGYKFVGWFDGKNIYEAGCKYTIVAENVEMTAKWEELPQYIISFTGGNYTTGMVPEAISVHEGDIVILPNNTFIKKGFKFVNWSDGNNSYEPGEKYKSPAKNVVMIAQWEKLPVYKITFAGGSGATGKAPSALSGNEKDKVNLPKNTFIKKGYEFVGWTDGSKTYKEGATYTIPAKDVKLTAKWKKKASTKRELIEQFAERMYTKALGRGADPDGLKYWADRLEKQIDDGANMAYGFITSEEFKARKLSDDQFIETMYQTFFGRTADSTGKTFWMNQIKSGASRETVLAGFVKSEEFGKLCSDAGIERGLILEDGTPVNAGIYQFVKRQYTCCLQREGDRDGIDYWATKIAKHEVSAVDTAKEFFFSTEFESKGLSDKQFVERLYETFLGRPFDETGYAYWNDKMSKGETRREVIDEFASSEEFKGILRGYGL